MSSKIIQILGWGLLMSLLYSSCAPKRYNAVTYDDFPVADSIYGCPLSETDSLPVFGQMFITGDWLVIHQWHNNGRPFRFYNTNNFGDFFDAGFIGHGNNEFTFIDRNFFYPASDVSFYLLDNDRLKQVSLREDRSLQTISTQKTFSQLPVNGFVLCGEDRCVSFADCAMGTTGDMEYRMLDLSSGQEKKFSPYPSFHHGTLDQDELCQLYYKRLVSNAKEHKLMAYYGYFPYLRLYDEYTGLTKEVWVGETEQSSDAAQRTRYFGSIYSTEDYVIVYSPIGLQVWSWNAEPLALLYPDRKVGTFCFDSRKGVLYAQVYDRDNDCYKLYSYKLPPLAPSVGM